YGDGDDGAVDPVPALGLGLRPVRRAGGAKPRRRHLALPGRHRRRRLAGRRRRLRRPPLPGGDRRPGDNRPMISLVAALIPVLAPVIASAAVGYVWARSRHPFDLGFVTRLVTYVGSPCLVFSALTKFHVPAGEILSQAGLAMLSVF